MINHFWEQPKYQKQERRIYELIQKGLALVITPHKKREEKKEILFFLPSHVIPLSPTRPKKSPLFICLYISFVCFQKYNWQSLFIFSKNTRRECECISLDSNHFVCERESLLS